jgi:hypothetical protein
MSNLSVSKVPRKTKNNPQPTLSENFNSHPLYFELDTLYIVSFQLF